MGGGGRHLGSHTEVKYAIHRVPCEKPPFTLKELKKAIPPHCFKRSILLSSSYLLLDMSIISILYFTATNCISNLPYHLSYIAWPLYWFCQGCVFTGVWMIGHECGHNAFSEHPWFDDTIGLLLHSALLSPYFSWKISHRRHHSNTSSLERDEVFVPVLRSKLVSFSKYYNTSPGVILKLLFMLLLGWPLYLLINIAGQPYDRFASHFYPYSPIFSKRERLLIFISDAAILVVVCGLLCLARIKGLAWLLCVYGAPLLVMNMFIVLITYLHHTHPSLPHYDSCEWDWMKGAFATVDRDYGFLNKVFHNITDTHITHHLFSAMPHYHAKEATQAIKPILGEFYQFDDTPILKALWRETLECVYIQQDTTKKGVFWYNNKL